jgi:hypothetical protein
MHVFRDERGRTIENKQLPFDVLSGPKIAVLIVPLSAMVDPLDLDFQDRKIELLIKPIPASGWGPAVLPRRGSDSSVE